MDWKYKHFNSETTFSASPSEVSDAARLFFSKSLGWQVEETMDGLQARGFSFAHAATAMFRIQPSTHGTKVTVELLVERAGYMGFMLFDVGGYYNRQIRKWFEGVQWQLHQRLVSPSEQESLTPVAPKQQRPGWASRLFGIFLYLVAIEWIIILLLFFLILPVVGLISGYLYIPGRGSGGVTLHGAWARIVSTIILMVSAYVLWKAKKKHRVSIKQQPTQFAIGDEKQ